MTTRSANPNPMKGSVSMPCDFPGCPNDCGIQYFSKYLCWKHFSQIAGLPAQSPAEDRLLKKLGMHRHPDTGDVVDSDPDFAPTPNKKETPHVNS